MPLRAVLLTLALLCGAQTAAPPSPVALAVAPQLTAAAPLPELIRGLDEKDKGEALKRLDALDRAKLNAEAQLELREAYRLLGRNAAAVQSSSAKGAAVEADALARQAKIRMPAAPDWKSSVPGGGVAPQAAANSGDDPRPFVLPIKAGKTGPPPTPGSDLAYVQPGTAKQSTAALLWNGLWNAAAYQLDTEPPEEKKEMSRLRASIDGTETGRRLVADLGGWTEIDKNVDMRFAKVWDDRTGAYAGPGGRGKKYVLVVNRNLLGGPDAVTVPIVAHELSHIRDFHQQGTAHGMAIPSEFAAHRTQVQIFEEIKAKMTPAQLAAYNSSHSGAYQNFITLIWEDHLLRRFKTPEDMARATGNADRFTAMSRAVMRDLKAGMQPGGFQLDHHLNGEKDGLYRVLTGEKDIVDLIREREASGSYGADDRKHDQELLARRNDLLKRSDKRDADFRDDHGFQLGAPR